MEPSAIGTDKVIVKGVQFDAVVGLDAWHRPGKTQPVQLEIHMTPPGGLEAAAREDSVAYTIDYGKFYKSLKTATFGGSFESVIRLYQAIRSIFPEVESWHISITLPKAILAANNGVHFTWNGNTDQNGVPLVMQVMTIHDIECRCIIGINSHERLEKQRLRITITIWGMENRLSPSIFAGVNMDPSPNLEYQEMVQDVVEVRFSCYVRACS